MKAKAIVDAMLDDEDRAKANEEARKALEAGDENAMLAFRKTMPHATVAQANAQRERIRAEVEGRRGEMTLRELFSETEPESYVLDEIGLMFLDIPVVVRTLSPQEVGALRTTSPGGTISQTIKAARSGPTWNIVQDYVKKFQSKVRVPPILIEKDAGYILDGHHRALAAFIAKAPVDYIDISEVESRQ